MRSISVSVRSARRWSRRLVRRVSRRRWTVVVIGVLLASGVLFYLLRPADDIRAGSELLPDAQVDVASRIAGSYRITYRVESRAGGELIVSTEDVLVRRPFDSRVSTRPPEGAQGEETVTINTFGRLSIRGQTLYRPPGPPDVDLRPAAVAAEAVREGYLARREARRVAGRPCLVFRTAGSFGRSLSGPAPDERDHAEVCVDEAGLVLEEVSVAEGEIVWRRVATEVSEDPAIPEDAFEVGSPPEPSRELGAVMELAPDSRLPGGPFWEVSVAPEGFDVVGRFAVVPGGQPGPGEPMTFRGIEAFVSEVWTDGRDIILIEQGGFSGRGPGQPDPSAVPVDAGELGEGELVYGLRSSEIGVALDGSRFVRVHGTVPPSKLLAVARSLEPKEPGPLIPLDQGA